MVHSLLENGVESGEGVPRNLKIQLIYEQQFHFRHLPKQQGICQKQGLRYLDTYAHNCMTHNG